MPITGWLVVAVTAALMVVVYWGGLQFLLQQWEAPEYGYAYMLPVIVAFLIWQKRDVLERLEFTGDWRGLLVLLLALGLSWAGKQGAVHAISHYSLLIAIFGATWSLVGVKTFRQLFMPLLILALAIPLPGFMYNTLSNELQLISSQIGVAVIRLFDISVYLEGNVIDLGTYKLQVVEACSGLRYLFPLMTLGFIAAYFFKVAIWKRVFVFLSTIPITVLMNSFRIGVIGVLVEHWGVSMAEGFLHDFEGWVIFMACLGVLLLEMWLFAVLSRDPRPLTQVFGIEFPPPTPEDAAVVKRSTPLTAYASLFAVAAMAAYVAATPERQDVIPEREDFTQFPMTLGDWRGRSNVMEQIVVDSLNFDDYLLADYRHASEGTQVGLYIGYYGIQRADKVPHSPAACLPGGGWLITERSQHVVDGVTIDGVPLVVNRFVIEQKGVRQLVYYWFQQRGRVVASEYLVKWHLLVDSVRMSRSDGALVRFTTLIGPAESGEDGDKRLTDYAAQVAPILSDYVPD